MELCFIWIEDYRNIKNQGFNFSSEYIFSFDIENNSLTVNKNSKYIDNFFGPGVTNITCIVGKNGAGKTNVLEIIDYLMNDGNTKVNNSFLLVYKDNKNNLYGYYEKFKSTPVSYEVSLSPYNENVNPFTNIFFSNVFDGRKHYLNKNTYDISMNRFTEYEFGETFQTNFSDEIRRQIDFVESSNFKYLLNIERELNPKESISIYPTHVSLTTPNWGNIITRATKFDKSLSEVLRQEVEFLKPFCTSFRKKITDNRSENRTISYLTAFLIFIDYIIDEFEIDFKSKDKIHYNVSDLIRTYPLNNISKFRIDEIHNYLTSEFVTKIENEADARIVILSSLKNLELFESEKFFDGIYNDRKIQLRIEYSRKVGEFIKEYIKAAKIEGLTYKFEWEGISSGHKAYISLFSRFYALKAEHKLKKDAVLICMDEGDLYFHPKWQSEFLSKIIKILPVVLGVKNIQIILTTHSPFLVSDLPKNHLIFLQKNSEGQSEVIMSDQVKIETFGGNIGELYLDAFFLKGSLISSFAKEKILMLFRNVKEAASIEQINSEDKILIEQIGESLIKNKLKDIINDLNK